jgi:hypothetical protein
MKNFKFKVSYILKETQPEKSIKVGTEDTDSAWLEILAEDIHSAVNFIQLELRRKLTERYSKPKGWKVDVKIQLVSESNVIFPMIAKDRNIFGVVQNSPISDPNEKRPVLSETPLTELTRFKNISKA